MLLFTIMNKASEYANSQDAKKEHHLDVLVRPSPFFLYAKILTIHLILGFFLMLVILLPRIFLGNITSDQLELVYQFKINIMVLMILIGEILTLIGVALWLSEIYVLKNKTVTHRTGIFFKHKRVIMLKQIVEVFLSQTFTGKIFNFGTIKIITPQATEDVYLKNIEHPSKYFRMLKDLVLEYKAAEFTSLPEVPPAKLVKSALKN